MIWPVKYFSFLAKYFFHFQIYIYCAIYVSVSVLPMPSLVEYIRLYSKKTEKTQQTLKEFIIENKYSLLKIFTFNFLMLVFGYLQEIGIINIFTSTIFGFIFFGLSFYYMYIEYAANSESNKTIYYIMLVLWSLYGIAALFKNNIKNTLYNILDIFSKNFYGLFLAFLVYSLRIK